MQKIVRVFPTSIGLYEDHDKDYGQIIEILSEMFDQKKHSEQGNLNLENFVQTPSGLHLNQAFSKVSNFVRMSVFDYITECGYDVELSDLYIADSWANISTGTVTTHTPHTHSNSFISAVLFVNAPKNSGSLYFMHPNMAVNSIDPDHKLQTVDNTTEVAFDPEPGLCLIFKSSTIHGTSYNMLNEGEYRISLAYNFNVKSLGGKSLFSHYEGIK